MSDYTGLNLFDKVLIPHAHKEKYAERIKLTIEEMNAQGLEIITLTDNQAIIVTDDGSKVVELKEVGLT